MGELGNLSILEASGYQHDLDRKYVILLYRLVDWQYAAMNIYTLFRYGVVTTVLGGRTAPKSRALGHQNFPLHGPEGPFPG